MITLTILSILFLILGLFVGKLLVSKGVHINLRIDDPKQQTNILIGLGFITFLLVLLSFFEKYNLTKNISLFIPAIISLYFSSYIAEFFIIICFFIIGILVYLEIGNNSTRQTKIQLFSLLLFISFILSLLIHQILPIANYISTSKMIGKNIVIQTTDYTCVPATIATLGRITGKYPEMTEKEATLLTKTDRRGTNTINEIKALKKLNFNPEYKRGLTVKDLEKINQLGILHVREKVGNKIFHHAVTFIEANPETQTVKVINPFYGIQAIPYDDMKEYWYGEGIFINESPFSYSLMVE